MTLKDVSGPVWRRLQVNGDMTFYEFHLALQ
ncbi:IS1096 element passenger TnpR family protein [Siminovitchia sp. 179-K 8D1 HS]